MVRSKTSNTEDVTAVALVFDVVTWNYMHLGFECCHGIILKNK